MFMAMIDARLNIVLHANQQRIHEHPARFKVIKAGKRFGKSKWAVFEIAQWAGRKNGGVFWYIAPTFGQAADIAWHDLLNIMPAPLIERKLETKLTLELKNGSRIVLKGAENENGLRGPGLDGVIFDEAAYIDQYVWPAIIRGQLAASRGPAYFISSPNKAGINWYTSFHLEAENRMKGGDKEWAAFYFTIHDNPILHKSEIADIQKVNLDSVWDLEYMAKESPNSGQIFIEFSPDRNIGEYDGTEKLLLFRGIDWGLVHPTVCLWVRLDLKTKNVYISDEYVKSGSLISESCDTIKRKTGAEPVEWTVIDPNTAKRSSQTLRRDIDEFARCGVSCIPADNRDRGYDIVRMFLKQGLIKISPHCTNLLNELRTVQWGQKKDDDCTDTLRYICVRIHDLFHGMNIMDDVEVSPLPKLEDDRQVSLYDTRWFPKQEKEKGPEWWWEEVA